MRSPIGRSLLASAALALSLSACSSNSLLQENARDLEFSLQAYAAQEQPEEVVARLNRVLAETQEDPGEFALQRFYAAFLLAQVNAATQEDPHTNSHRTIEETADGLLAAFQARQQRLQAYLELMGAAEYT